jgi:hypothetical protein
VLTQYRKRNRGNIGICPPSCDEPHGEATDSRAVTGLEQRGSLANPDMERTEVKNAFELCFCCGGGLSYVFKAVPV